MSFRTLLPCLPLPQHRGDRCLPPCMLFTGSWGQMLGASCTAGTASLSRLHSLSPFSVPLGRGSLWPPFHSPHLARAPGGHGAALQDCFTPKACVHYEAHARGLGEAEEQLPAPWALREGWGLEHEASSIQTHSSITPAAPCLGRLAQDSQLLPAPRTSHWSHACCLVGRFLVLR